MLGWLLLTLLAALHRVRQRKHADYPEPTTRGDYITSIVSMVVGIVLYALGTCILEIVLLLAGIIVTIVFITRMKLLDKKDKERLEKIKAEIKGQVLETDNR